MWLKRTLSKLMVLRFHCELRSFTASPAEELQAASVVFAAGEVAST